jgi:hypothetical protein
MAVPFDSLAGCCVYCARMESGDDRILLVPVFFASAPRVFEKWPAVRVLLARLRGFLPVDIHLWPSAEGSPRTGASEGFDAILARLRGSIKPNHHVVDLGTGGEFLLTVLARQPARSLVVAGYQPMPATVELTGDSTLANAMRFIGQARRTNLGERTNPEPLVRMTMQGLDEKQIAEVVRDIEEHVDLSRGPGSELMTGTSLLTDEVVDLPALHLLLPVPLPGIERTFEFFKKHVPRARTEPLEVWPLRVHEEEGGHELADKVIPFIQSVIAEREKAG